MLTRPAVAAEPEREAARPAPAPPTPAPRSPAAVLALQRSAGNAAVAGLLRPPAVQAHGVPAARPFELRPAGAGRPLEGVAQARLEGALGQDLSDVRVHEDGEAERAGANALASGSNVHVARGRYQPESADGFGLLAHEIAHVAQQRAGRVPEGSSGCILQDPGLEAEADAFAAQAATTAPAPAPRRAARHVSRSVAQLNPAAAAPLVFAGLSAEAWGIAANFVGVVGAVGGTVAGGYTAVQPGSNGFASLMLPGKVMSAQDQNNLQQIAQFDIINAYVARYVERHPEETSGPTQPPAEAPDTGDAPTGGAKGEEIDQQVLQQVGTSVQGALEKALETNLQRAEREYMWSEDDAHAESEKIGGTAGDADSVGVTGFLQLRNMEGVALERTLQLSPEAEQLVGSVPGNGQTVLVRRFFGGLVSGDATESMWQSLSVNVEGGAAQESVSADGAPLFIVRTLWYWDRWGLNTESRMQTNITLGPTGLPWFASEYEGSPG